MAKVITDIHGFLEAVSDYLWDDDREILEQLVERFSENVVIAADRYAVADAMCRIATEEACMVEGWGDRDLLLEDPDIEWDRLIDECRDIDQEQVGYTYEAIKEAVKRIYTPSQCEEFVYRLMSNNPIPVAQTFI